MQYAVDETEQLEGEISAAMNFDLFLPLVSLGVWGTTET